VVIVRPATAQDVPALRSLGVRTWRDAFEGVLPDAVVAGGIAELFNEYTLAAAVRQERMLAALRDGVLVGLLEFDRVDATRTMVWKVYVAPEAQGRGIGGRLLERLLQIARTPEVRAEHDERNVGAAALFDAFGFAVDASDEDVSGSGTRTVRRVRRLSPPNAPR
jgi:ribosomal protein S18 acetylase RimI-like enzyme